MIQRSFLTNGIIIIFKFDTKNTLFLIVRVENELKSHLKINELLIYLNFSQLYIYL